MTSFHTLAYRTLPAAIANPDSPHLFFHFEHVESLKEGTVFRCRIDSCNFHPEPIFHENNHRLNPNGGAAQLKYSSVFNILGHFYPSLSSTLGNLLVNKYYQMGLGIESDEIMLTMRTCRLFSRGGSEIQMMQATFQKEGRDALKSFIQGYQKVFSRKTTICEYSSRCSVEGRDFFLSYSFLGQWAYYQSFHYASVGAGTVYYDSATNLGSNAEDHGSAEAFKKLLLNISKRISSQIISD
ncbi:hypothetical protein OIU85_017214 [Salix viminalis]|uniref:Uncharacterized protein n=1 Tax=Salix viminalis TaxID=40686 RepID=A0A9Q0V7M4_SALVM|nr:hypothetical protein OIU85_017214 [Salix viminalis]